MNFLKFYVFLDNLKMQLIFEPSSNNSTLNSGDVFKVTLTYIPPITTINNISITFSPTPTATEYHNPEIRFSIDGVNYSAWLPFPTDLTNLSNILNNRIVNVWFEFRFTRVSTIPSTIILTQIVIDYTLQEIAEELCPIPCASSCGIPTEEIGRCSKEFNSCSGVTVSCDSALFRINDYAGALACLYNQVAEASAAMTSWNVYYFQVKPTIESKDIILHEYTLHNVVAAKMLPVIVPDNTFPSSDLQFSSFDLGFSEDFEIIIMKNSFENAFGLNERPNLRDFLYFPIQNRLWEVHGANLAREDFMQFPNQYKVKLYKWQDKKNISREPQFDNVVNAIATNFEELFREEELEEFDKVTHPLQYKLITVGDGDHIRQSISEDLVISDTEIDNFFTKVAKNVYNLNTVTPLDIPVVEYKKLCDIDTSKNLSVSFWFRSVKTRFQLNTNNFDRLLSSQLANTGFDFKVNYNLTPANNIASFELTLQNNQFIFDNLPTLDFNNWYGCVLNISNIHNTIEFKIWKIAYIPTNPATRTTKLQMIYSKTITFSPINFNNQEPYKLFSATSEITNIRLWNQPIPEEQQSQILNQYIVKDSQYLILADNAMKPFILNKLNRR